MKPELNRRLVSDFEESFDRASAEKRLVIVSGQAPEPEPMKPCFLKRCFDLLSSTLKKLGNAWVRACETDEQIRKMRAENYAKYISYFRDRF